MGDFGKAVYDNDMLTPNRNTMLKQPILEMLNYIVCPECHSDLNMLENRIKINCMGCSKEYSVTELGQLDFVNSIFQNYDRLDRTKEALKKLIKSKVYTLLHFVLTPTYPILANQLIKKSAWKHSGLRNMNLLNCINLGGGNFDLKFCLNVDLRNYQNVHIIADVIKLPFSDNCIDISFSRALVEHLEYPREFATELFRVSKQNSFTIHVYPLAYPIHGSPFDYFRYTPSGFARIFEQFKVVESYSTSGPFSSFIVYTAELAASILSFGNKTLKTYTLLTTYVLLSPLKWLDFFFLMKKSILAGSVHYLMVLKKL